MAKPRKPDRAATASTKRPAIDFTSDTWRHIRMLAESAVTVAEGRLRERALTEPDRQFELGRLDVAEQILKLAKAKPSLGDGDDVEY